MRDVMIAITIVGAMVAGILVWPQWNQGKDSAVPEYVELPEVERPNYQAVVQDVAERDALREEAEAFIEQVAVSDTAIALGPEIAALGRELPAGQTAADAFVLQGPDAPLPLPISAKPGDSLTIRSLLTSKGYQPRTHGLYFVHEVEDADRQGLWGVVQTRLVQRFAEGIALNRGEAATTYQVTIPAKADERLLTGQSSFLGKVLHQKSAEAFVYDRLSGNVKRNPPRIYPGDEVVIIGFDAEELVGVYQYFASQEPETLQAKDGKQELAQVSLERE